MSLAESTLRYINVLQRVPFGKVASYAQIAGLAGYPRGARQVSRILHSSSDKYSLPWHRIVKANGAIALPPQSGGNLQASMLRAEGIDVSEQHKIDLEIYGWKPEKEIL
jgi:methylated-DNA-protein-cysteine methyltransferase related protein